MDMYHSKKRDISKFPRRRLAGELPDIELRIATYLEVNNISKLSVSGYRVRGKGRGASHNRGPQN